MADKPLLSNVSGEKQRLLGALMAALRNNELMSDQLLPAIVQSFDRANNVATIQPLIQWVDVNDGLHSRHPLARINVLSLGGGGFHISFPLAPGDLGWILASDRDISLFKQSLAESQPNTGRLHKFEDGWFVPDVFKKYAINSADSAAMVIQSVDGATRIAINENSINITATSAVNVTAPQTTFNGNVTITQNLTVQQSATIDQNLTVQQSGTINHNLSVGDSATVTNSITADHATITTDATIAGISQHGHGHIVTGTTRTLLGEVP